MGEIHVTLWTAKPIKTSLPDRGQWGSCTGCGKGKGGGQGGSTNHQTSPDPRPVAMWRCIRANWQIPSQEKRFGVISEPHVFSFWMVRANMWDTCWCHMVKIDKANLFVSYLFLIYYVIYYVIYCNLYMYTYKPMFSLSSWQSLKNIPNCFGVMPSCPCIASEKIQSAFIELMEVLAMFGKDVLLSSSKSGETVNELFQANWYIRWNGIE